MNDPYLINILIKGKDIRQTIDVIIILLDSIQLLNIRIEFIYY
jgi:hypothetical protein